MNSLSRIFTSFIVASIFLLSCTRILCGELKGEWKKRFETVENRYAENFSLENIPCESFYLNVHMKIYEIDTSSIKKAHEILYDEESKVGWMSLHVFNPEGEFLFTHSHDGKISTVKPNW